MDISVYISGLLYHHNCIIIPGLGGLVCNYRAAEIHPVQHTIAPPAKAIAFNKNLYANDGLLINHIAEQQGISYAVAEALVEGWVSATKALLNSGDKVAIKKVGELSLNIEGAIQFNPYNEYNYLKESFGLRTIVAQPVVHAKVVPLNPETETNETTVTRRPVWKIAAMVALLLGMVGVMQLMWSGVEIKGLKADEAGVMNFLNKVFTPAEAPLQPLPLEIEEPTTEAATEIPEAVTESAEAVLAPETEAAVAEPEAPVAEVAETNYQQGPQKGYYIIVGSFTDAKYIARAKEQVLAANPGAAILEETTGNLTRIGYYAGLHYPEATGNLSAARQTDTSYWLLYKR